MKKVVIVLFVSLIFQCAVVCVNADTRGFVEKYIDNSVANVNFNRSAAAYGVLYCGNAVLMYGEDRRVVYYIRDREVYPYNTAEATVTDFERRLEMMRINYNKSTVGGLTVIRLSVGCDATLAFDSTVGALMYAYVSK